jgi:hypothetical protein
MESLAERVVRRFMAFKYEPKETKKTKAERLMKLIRDKTGLSKGQSEEIADIIVRGRDLEALALQKNLPVTDGTIEGPKGSLSVSEVKSGL